MCMHCVKVGLLYSLMTISRKMVLSLHITKDVCQIGLRCSVSHAIIILHHYCVTKAKHSVSKCNKSPPPPNIKKNFFRKVNAPMLITFRLLS